MSQYSRRYGNGGNGGRNARFQEEEEDEHTLPVVRERREKAGLGLRERLPLPSGPKPTLNPSSPTPPMNRSRGSSPLQQSNHEIPRLNTPGEYDRAGRSLTNPSAGRARQGTQSRQQFQPSDGRQQEQDVGIAYGGNKTPTRSQPRYNRPVDYEEDIDSRSLMASPTIGDHTSMMNSPRSILIGFDDSVPTNPPRANLTPLAPMPQSQPRRSTNAAPPSSRRGGSSYYSQPAIQVSPIPEESPNPRHGSYASSHVIPSTWGNVDYPPQLSPSMYGEDDDEDNYRPMPEDDDEKGLVRQASLGRKSRPTITEIRSPSRQEMKQTFLHIDSESPEPKESSSTNRNISPLTTPIPAVSTPTSAKVPSALMAFSFPAPGNFEAVRKEVESSSSRGVDSVAHSRNSSVYTPTVEPLNPFRAGSMAARMKGRRAPPPGLNLGAVRDAEARGSLTSLPDLIRRATKLAAALENGKSRDGSWRGSFTASHLTNSSSNRRRTDSISDILASFPPPVPGAGGSRNGRNGSRTLSSWPIAANYMDNNGGGTSLRSTPKKGRRICGLPLWAFILLVILALLVIAAAVIVPLQLVTLSRSQENDSTSNSNAEILRQCKISNPCANGGENVATKDFCGCVCTGGFGGKTCTELDSSCVTMDLEEIKRFGDTFDGIQNATMGSSIKRLLEISNDKYNVPLDGSRMLSAFWASGVSCTAQNALVTFNGKTAPVEDSTTTSLSILPTTTPAPGTNKRQLPDVSEDEPLVYDTSVIGTKTQDPYPRVAPTTAPTPPAPTSTGATANPGIGNNRAPALDEDAVDFSRVAVLYLVQDKSLNVAVTAQENLQRQFTSGVDYGSVDVGNKVIVDLDNRVLNLPGGISVGGP